jgi:hypothetical protein
MACTGLFPLCFVQATFRRVGFSSLPSDELGLSQQKSPEEVVLKTRSRYFTLQAELKFLGFH